MTWSSESLAGFYAKLLQPGISFIVVGGQAVNLWAEYYRQNGRWSAEFSTLLPFTSHDLDLLGGSLIAEQMGKALAVEWIAFPHTERCTAPNTGTLYLRSDCDELVVQFLHTPFGTNPREVRSTVQYLSWMGLDIPVMHPLLCLEGKIACLSSLDQRTRQDEKHAKLSVLSLRAFTTELLEPANDIEVREIIHRIIDLALDERGLRAWLDHGIRCEDSLPMEELRKAASVGWPKLASFFEKEWPRREADIEQTRRRYSELAERKEAGRKGNR